LRIAFDARAIREGKSGVGVYAAGLIEALTRLDGRDEYTVIANRGFRPPAPGPRVAMTRLSLEDHPLGDLWEQFVLPAYLRRNGFDIYHSPTFHGPFVFKGAKTIVTVHDLVTFLFPETQPRAFAAYSRFMTRAAVRASSGVIVPSESTRRDLVRLLKADEGRIHVVPYAHGGFFAPVKNPSMLLGVRERFGLPERFVLFVGSLEPRKNAVMLVKAYSAIRRDGIPHKLVICGGAGWLNEKERVLKAVADEGLGADVLFTGYVRDELMPAIYSMAEVFVYPSLYEGFGFPVLEAMACGCPVVASNVSSIPEVAGDAALLVGPADLSGLKDAVSRVLTDGGLRGRLIEAGLRRAREFSWEKTARETVRVYEKVARGCG
jgi:glycosyltransferase involved in cell wall biosynthesis